MKPFLTGITKDMPVMPLHIYYNRGGYKRWEKDDMLYFIYKDMTTGQKLIEFIPHPTYEVRVLLPEYRDDTFSYIHLDVEESKTYLVTVSYKNRYAELSKATGIPTEDLASSPYLFGFDVPLENFYMMEFIRLYPTDKPKKLTCGFFDIETDILSIPGFPEPGEVPISCVTYMDDATSQSYTFVLGTDNVPHLSEGNPLRETYETYREDFQKAIQSLKEDPSLLLDQMGKVTGDQYQDLQFQFKIYEDELTMITDFFRLLHTCSPDICFAWNIAFDLPQLMERIRMLGGDPDRIIPDPLFGKQHVSFEEDTNPMVHQKKHKIYTYTLTIFLCQMVSYAGIRASRGVLPTVKLNAIAKKELKDSKLDYSEYGGNTRFFLYRATILYYLYNIKDVILQVGLERKNRDSDTIYGTMYENGILCTDVTTSTKILEMDLRRFGREEENLVFGTNRNKIRGAQYEEPILLADEFGEIQEEDEDDSEEEDEEKEEAVQERSTDPKKRKKIAGAFIQNPRYMSPTGTKVLGRPAKYVHSYVVDEDIRAEYPTGMQIMNASVSTMVGKVFLDHPEEYMVPLYEGMYFATGKEKASYHMDPSAFVMEAYSERDLLNFGSLMFKLPTITDLFEEWEKEQEEDDVK